MSNGEQLIVAKSAHYYRFWLVAALLAALVGAVGATAVADAPPAIVSQPSSAPTPSATTSAPTTVLTKAQSIEAGELARRYCRDRMNSFVTRTAGRTITLAFRDGFVVGTNEDGRMVARVDGNIEPVKVGKQLVGFEFGCYAQTYDPLRKTWIVKNMWNKKYVV